MNNIPVFKPHLRVDEIQKALQPVFESGWIGLGPKTEQFEHEFSSMHEGFYAVAVNSCTAALHMALKAIDIKEGDEILVPAMSFVSTALVALYEKAVPVFVDCDPVTLNMDTVDAARKVTKKTKAIIVTHLGGHAAEMANLRELADGDPKIYLIEDNAHGCGGKYLSKRLGTFGDLSCFSFHAVKNLATGDGGMVLVNPKLGYGYNKLKRLRWLGIDKDTWARNDLRYQWKYKIDELGYKCHMNDITATIGSVQLKYVDEDNRKRAAIADMYREMFAWTELIEAPVASSFTEPSWHNYVIKLHKSIDREELASYLATNGISTSVHYEPLHHHKVFDGRSIAKDLTVVESVWERILTLPMYPTLAPGDVDYIAGKVNQFIAEKEK